MILNLFSTPILRAPLTDSKTFKSLQKTLLQEIQTLIEIDADGRLWSEKNYQNGYTSYGSVDRLFEVSPNFKRLSRLMKKHINSFVKANSWDLKGVAPEICSLWVNSMPANTIHTLHIHPLSIVSGTVYLKVPKGTSPIKFEDPRLDRFMAEPPRLDSTPAPQKIFYELTPREGEIVLFPSWLRHEVPQVPSKIKEPRVSVSFNYDWK